MVTSGIVVVCADDSVCSGDGRNVTVSPPHDSVSPGFKKFGGCRIMHLLLSCSDMLCAVNKWSSVAVQLIASRRKSVARFHWSFACGGGRALYGAAVAPALEQLVRFRSLQRHRSNCDRRNTIPAAPEYSRSAVERVGDMPSVVERTAGASQDDSGDDSSTEKEIWL